MRGPAGPGCYGVRGLLQSGVGMTQPAVGGVWSYRYPPQEGFLLEAPPAEPHLPAGSPAYSGQDATNHPAPSGSELSSLPLVIPICPLYFPRNTEPGGPQEVVIPGTGSLSLTVLGRLQNLRSLLETFSNMESPTLHARTHARTHLSSMRPVALTLVGRRCNRLISTK